MIIRAFSFLFIFLSVSVYSQTGYNKQYKIISQQKYDESLRKGKNVISQKFIVVPELEKDYKMIYNTTDQEELLSIFSFMLKRGKIYKMQDYLLQCDKSLEVNELLNGLFHFYRNDFSEALSYLENYNNVNHYFLRYLLIADCKYELLSDKKNYKSVLNAYQLAHDVTSNKQNQAIVNNRIKLIKYRS